MLISEQIENIVDNLGLERQTNQCRKGYAKLMNGDLSVFETYNGDELVQAVIDEFKLINAPSDKQLANQAFIDRQVTRIESARLELLASLTVNDANQYNLTKSLINEIDLLALIIEMQTLAAINNK